MKILSIAVPCYNSQDYMEKCVDSLLKGGEDVEILIVDDGSKDATAEIADAYEKKYPTGVPLKHRIGTSGWFEEAKEKHLDEWISLVGKEIGE